MRRFFISLTLLLTLTGFRFTTISEAGTRGSSDPQLRIGNASIHISFNKGYRYERFYFFVNYDVYYSTYSDRYYWYDRGRWHSSRRLPSYLRHATRDRYIVINARHDRPWTYHADRWRYDSRYDRWDRRDDRRKDDRYDRYDDRRKDDRYDRKNDRRDDRRTDNDWDRNRDRDNNRKNDKQGRRN